MKNWIKRLLMVTLLLMAILLLAAPGALADYAKDFSDFDETDWENFRSGGMYICPGCEDWYSEGNGCEECYLCWDCCADSTDHCPNDAMHGWDEDTWCESCGCAPCCHTFEIAEAAGWGVGSICDFCIESNQLGFDFCQICYQSFDELPEYGYCCECFMCYECWDASSHCANCGMENDLCPDCDPAICWTCHEEWGVMCPECGETCLSATNGSAIACGGGGTHCVENCCNWEWLCGECGNCFFEDQGEYCEDCGLCMTCALSSSNHCLECEECFEGVEACAYDGICINCCPDATGEHCESCEQHVGYDTDEWCFTGGEFTHCMSCMENFCEQCEICFDCSGEDICGDCGLCSYCCLENSEAEGCACGMCVEDGDFEEHLWCPSCGGNLCESGDEVCEYCSYCPECCLEFSEAEGCACGMCVEDSDFYDHLSCPDCDYNLCDTGDELCEYCNLCPECCLANSEAEGCACGMCVEDGDFEEHLLCPDCGYNLCENGEEVCDTCGLCPECCLFNSEDAGCICGMCAEDGEFEEHVTCKGCDDGLCASGEPPCDTCGLCVYCCEDMKCIHGVCHADRAEMRAHTCQLCGECYSQSELCATCGDNHEIICRACCASESTVVGCSHGVCPNDAEAWLAHWCWECSMCVSKCPHDTPQGEHPVTPSLSFTYDKVLHWRECRYCSESSHHTGRAAHNFSFGTCRFCHMPENIGTKPYIVQEPKNVTVIQPNPGEEDVTATFSAVIGNGDGLVGIVWEREWIIEREIDGETVVETEWRWPYELEREDYFDENGNRVAVATLKIHSESCQNLNDKGYYARYRLHVWKEDGSEAYTYPNTVRVQHNALAYNYLKEDQPGYGAKKNRYSGVHWPCCSICGGGDLFAEAEVHTGEWKLKEGTKDVYSRNCDVCGAYEEWYGSDLLINGHPKNETIELLHDPEPGVVKTVVFSIPDCTVTPSGITGDDYTWEFSLDGVKWYTAFDKRAEELKCGFTFLGTYSKELKVYTTTETPCNGTKYYFRCKIGGLYTNQATLRIKCNQEGYSFYPQKKNNAIGAQGMEIYMNKHWPACTGCGKNEDLELAEAHVFGGTLHDAEKDLDYKVCATCGYEEWEYADDEFHFKVNPVSMTIANARPGNIVQLRAEATGTDEEIYYMWLECEPVQVDAINNIWGIQSWDIVHQGKDCMNFDYEVSEADCDYSQRSGYHRAFICFAKAGEPIDPYAHNWAKDVIATNYVKLTFEHNQDGYNYDDLYHWPACSHCGKNENLDAFQPHDIGQWQAVNIADDGSVTFERSCVCGYTETTKALATDVYAYVSNIMRPAPGALPDFNASIQTSSGTRENEVKWYKLNENGEKNVKPMGDQDVFEENTAYRVEITLRAKSGVGYSLREDQVQINGESANWYYPAEGVGVVTLYTDYSTADCITFVDIYDIIQPIADTMIVYTAESGTYDSSIEPVNGNDVAWYYLYDGGEGYVSWPKEWTVNENYAYRAEVVLQAEEGKYFAIDQNGNAVVTAKINSKSAKVTVDDSLTYGNVRYIKVSYDFGKPQKTKGVLITGHEVTSGQWLGNNGHVYNGTPSGTGWAWYKDGKLTLNNFSDTAESGVRGIVIYRPLTIELIGKNSLTVEDYASGINVAGNLVIEGSGSLTLNSGKAGINVSEGSLIMNGGTVIVNAGNEALYIGNHNDSSKTLVLNGGYLKLTSRKYEGLYMLSWMDGYRTPIHVNGGTMIMSGPDYATNVWAIDGLATVMAGTSDSDAVVLDDIGMMSTYPYVKIAHNKQDAYYVVAQPVDTVFTCGPEAAETVDFVLSNEADEYTWYLDIGDGNGFVSVESLAMDSLISAMGWNTPSLKIDAGGISTAQAYCVAKTEMETFTSDTVTLTLEHVYSMCYNINDAQYHASYCSRCEEYYPQFHTLRYHIHANATNNYNGYYNYDCALCGYEASSENIEYSMVTPEGTKLTLDWNDGLGTKTEMDVTRYATNTISVYPEREGYRFLGWAVLPDAAEPDYGSEIPAIQASMTLYAVWTPYDYAISGWVSSDGTAENPIPVKIDLYKLGADGETLVQTVDVVCDDANTAEAFSFEMLWPGDYRIKATSAGYGDVTLYVSVSENYETPTQHIQIERAPIARMDFTVKNLAANNYCAGIVVTTDTPGISVNNAYGTGGYQLYSDSDGYVGDALIGGKIEGGKFYWVRVDYTIDEEYNIDWYNYSHVMNGCIVSTNYDMSDNCYAYFRMYVPTNGAEATGTLDIGCYGLPEAFGQADAYPYFSLSGTLNGMLVDQMWMKGEEWFAGTFEQGETYTLYASVMMSDGSKVPEGVYVTVNGEAPTSIEYSGNLLIVTKDYKVDSMTTFKLPAAITTIEAEAFEGSIAEAFEIPAGCTSIGSRAFANCPNLKVLIIRSSSINIADDALEGNFEATGACRVTIISPEGSDLPSWCKQHGVNWQPLN